MEILILLAIIILPIWAQTNVMNVIHKYLRVKATNGMSGAEVAKFILEQEGITNVSVKQTSGTLSDHYNPSDKTVNLSQDVYARNSVASICIAAHEVGHAIQDATNYNGLKARNTIYPFAKTGGALASISILIGILAQATGLLYLGIICLGAILAFQMATLPVEFDASMRAMDRIKSYGLLSSEEVAGGEQVLRAAALTYIVAALTTFLNIVRLLMIARRSD